MQREFGHAGGEEVAYGWRCRKKSDAAIGWMGFALDEALFYEPVDDAGDGAVSQADGFAELLEAETVGADESGHDQALRTGEMATGEFGLEALAHATLDDVELALGLLGERAQFEGWSVCLMARVGAVSEVPFCGGCRGALCLHAFNDVRDAGFSKKIFF